MKTSKKASWNKSAQYWVLVSLPIVALTALFMRPAQADQPAAAATATAVEPPNNADSITKGDALFHQFCAGCHGADAKGGHGGEGMSKVPPDLTDAVWLYGGSNPEIFRTIKQGVPPDFAMVPWEGVISDPDIWNIVHYVKSLQAKK